MLTIRPATLAVLDAIRVVHTSSIQATCASSYSPEQIAAWLAHLTPERSRQSFEEGGQFVALQDSTVVGFGKLRLASATVNAVYVAPMAQGFGVGRLASPCTRAWAPHHAPACSRLAALAAGASRWTDQGASSRTGFTARFTDCEQACNIGYGGGSHGHHVRGRDRA